MANIPIWIVPEIIPRVDQKILCATFLEAVVRFYEVSENRESFEQWRTGKGETAVGQKDSGYAAAGIP